MVVDNKSTYMRTRKWGQESEKVTKEANREGYTSLYIFLPRDF